MIIWDVLLKLHNPRSWKYLHAFEFKKFKLKFKIITDIMQFKIIIEVKQIPIRTHENYNNPRSGES